MTPQIPKGEIGDRASKKRRRFFANHTDDEGSSRSPRSRLRVSIPGGRRTVTRNVETVSAREPSPKLRDTLPDEPKLARRGAPLGHREAREAKIRHHLRGR